MKKKILSVLLMICMVICAGCGNGNSANNKKIIEQINAIERPITNESKDALLALYDEINALDDTNRGKITNIQTYYDCLEEYNDICVNLATAECGKYNFKKAIEYTEMTIGNLTQEQQELVDKVIEVKDAAMFSGTEFVMPDFVIEHDENDIATVNGHKFTIAKQVVKENDEYVFYNYEFYKEKKEFGSTFPTGQYDKYLDDNFEHEYSKDVAWVTTIDPGDMGYGKVVYTDSYGNVLTTSLGEDSWSFHYNIYIKKAK